MESEQIIQFLIPYAVGTVLGLYWGVKSNARKISDATIELLMREGFVKFKRLKDGEVELIKIANIKKDAI